MFGKKGWCGNERAEGLEVKTPIEEGVPGLVGAKGVCSIWDSSISKLSNKVVECSLLRSEGFRGFSKLVPGCGLS